MHSKREFLQQGLAASAALALGSAPALAQAGYPDKPIHTICMFPPGSGADVTVRFFSKKLSDALGKPVVVENRVGAFGNIATEAVARAKPDGYTIYIAPGSSVFAAAKHLFKKLPFDPVTDFEHVTTLARLPFLLIVAGDSPYKTVADLTADLKAKGDKASYGSVANTGLVGSELYKAEFGLKTVEVKYKDPQSMVNDLLGGNISFSHIDPTSVLGQLQSGKVRALATTAADRMKAMPSIPSAKDAGITNSDLTAWWSVHVPAKTDPAIVALLEKTFNEIAVQPEVAKFLNDIGVDTFPGDSKVLKALLAKDLDAWGKYVALAKIEQL
ncbi:MAG: Tripartite-type tricarboxylate transporter, receptor component TctC [Hyphomicrobiales bacterium]|nr:Tripartite-type tricarboxylate transporter, receptor component TctC [Hyphomicrobiales bacterium]